MSIFSNLADLRIASVVVGSLAFFYLYYYFAHSSILQNKIYQSSTGNHRELWLFFGRKLSGVVFLGILPALLYSFLLKGTILIPVFMHISLSGFSNYYSIRFNPNINFVSYNPLKSKKL